MTTLRVIGLSMRKLDGHTEITITRPHDTDKTVQVDFKQACNRAIVRALRDAGLVPVGARLRVKEFAQTPRIFAIDTAAGEPLFFLEAVEE